MFLQPEDRMDGGAIALGKKAGRTSLASKVVPACKDLESPLGQSIETVSESKKYCFYSR